MGGPNRPTMMILGFHLFNVWLLVCFGLKRQNAVRSGDAVGKLSESVACGVQ